ncbi:vWA domain-containing protein [Brackiella oedipodis]|uniref:vWA domain-containing protein n=1 Tax=Brackiella oedipodis TaxID=124225 RepID=UPI00048E4F93|nr:VWA domain-containing protein [Brackiella oedipodis]
MLLDFFYHLRKSGLPVSVKEFLTLLEVLRQAIMPPTLNDFYVTARMTLIKDESLYDRYDRAFSSFVKGAEPIFETFKEIPADWLISKFKKELSDAEKAAIEKHGLDKLMQMFRERLEEQQERHAGGNRWIGTGGTSPFGNSGYHPEGIRVGGASANRSAVKVWDERLFQEYDNQQELGARNFKMALRKLRNLAREGVPEELDLDGTIRSTANNAGYLDLKMLAKKRNNVKVLMLLDTGGSMDDHVQRVEQLFTAASSEFRHLEVYYFHNCVYERVWRYNANGRRNYTDTWHLIHTYNPEWKLIFVGDASMGPYEIMYPGGSIEHMNEETGATWLQRLTEHFDKSIWLNPEPQGFWQYRHSIAIIHELMQKHMYSVTVSGLNDGMKYLSK